MEVESSVMRDVRLAKDKEKYDTYAKNILSNKEILAQILKSVVSEFKEMPVGEICECIENPNISNIRVNPGETNVKISGKSNENAIPEEGTVLFDIIFDCFVPNEEGKIKIIINIEAQNKSEPGYEIVTRAIYYCARMISSQYEREFRDSQYDKIKKVYSIWICTEPSKSKENSIIEFSIKKRGCI